MPGFDDCPTCPYRDRPEVCHAYKLQHRGLCRPEFAAVVEAHTLGQPIPVKPQRARQPLSPEQERTYRLHKLMIGCEHRKPDGKRCVDCRALCTRDVAEGAAVLKEHCYQCKTAEADAHASLRREARETPG